MSAPLYVALLHYPVYKKNGEVITTSITPMDLHDIARTCLTFGVQRYYAVNHLPTMQYLARRIANFWESDYGRNYNKTRTDAFSIFVIVEQLEDCIEDIQKRHGVKPKLVATSAKPYENNITFEDLAERIANGSDPCLILLGTGYGLIGELVRRCDMVLEPVWGSGEYNHLSVRSAAAIILDRLCNYRKKG